MFLQSCAACCRGCAPEDMSPFQVVAPVKGTVRHEVERFTEGLRQTSNSTDEGRPPIYTQRRFFIRRPIRPRDEVGIPLAKGMNKSRASALRCQGSVKEHKMAQSPKPGSRTDDLR